MLSDEATSALGPETTRSILFVKTINVQLGLTVLLITHEMDVVKRVCDSAAMLENGRILEQGRVVTLISTPGSRLVHELLHSAETQKYMTDTWGARHSDRVTLLKRMPDHVVWSGIRCFGVRANA